MLKQLCFIITFFFGFIAVATAQSIADIFSTSKVPITYIGLDFSKVKLVGSEGFSDPIAIQAEYFDKWNNLILEEGEKFDLKAIFVKQTVDFDLTPIQALNGEIDAANLVIDKSATALTPEQLQEAAGRYDFKDFANKIAIVFIVESFDKVAELGTFHLTFVNTTNNQIIWTQKVTGKPKGFGLRNYWAGAFYDALQNVQSKWKLWKKSAESKEQ